MVLGALVMAMLFNVIIFIIGLYVSLTVLDKMFVQGSSPYADITIPLYLGGYVLIAPLLFFLPLGSARRTMKQAKKHQNTAQGASLTH